ncbi:hypothetical protein [Tuwongella immobilis]|uniref:Uncharacterized protein n=1 Tax=Tuwongella immobilis TaxID=692036 RepID=A0A6C2YL94_9BACT|nr:hypothetical protein [Tuwongella immobilis]VIP02081.1 unnamed protein product [Tuwongella immobilis]VTS00329.1 unnamed protein product [Tuwongella immobilis]
MGDRRIPNGPILLRFERPATREPREPRTPRRRNEGTPHALQFTPRKAPVTLQPMTAEERELARWMDLSG